MRQVGIILLVLIAVIAGLAGYGLQGQGGFFGNLLNQRTKAPSPLAACRSLSESEARPVAEKIVAGFNALDPEPFNRAMVWDVPLGQAIHDIALSMAERQGFIDGARENVVKETGPAVITVANLKKPDRMHLLRLMMIDGHQHAKVRVLIGDGFTYLDLVIARAPSGVIGLVDYTDMMTGQPYSSQLAEVCLPMLAQMMKTPLERLITGDNDDLVAVGQQIPVLHTLIQSGLGEQAYKQYLDLPRSFRETKIGMMLRLRITQLLGDERYQETMAEIDRLFPNDPTMGLTLLDWHLLAGRTRKALHIIDRIDEQIGGDPYLDNVRALTHVLGKDLPQAEAAADRACLALPYLAEVWWTRVTVALRREDHPATARLLDTMTERFGMTYADLTTVPDYAAFVQSEDYRNWLARQRKRTIPGSP